MTTPRDFDYDLWKSTDGKFFVRIKRTGDVCEVDAETFRTLHNEAMALYRDQQGIPVYMVRDGKSVLACRVPLLHLGYDSDGDDVDDTWAVEHTQTEDDCVTAELERILYESLTDKQREVYIHCLLGDMTLREYADWKGIYFTSVQALITAIRKKARNIFK